MLHHYCLENEIKILTVAAQCQGMPKKPQKQFSTHSNTMSMCSPDPFFRPRSGLSTISSEICVSIKIKINTSNEGIKAANGSHTWENSGVMSHPRRTGSLGETPVGTLNFSEYTSGVKKSMSTKQVIAIGTPKSPRALRALRPMMENQI